MMEWLKQLEEQVTLPFSTNRHGRPRGLVFVKIIHIPSPLQYRETPDTNYR